MSEQLLRLWCLLSGNDGGVEHDELDDVDGRREVDGDGDNDDDDAEEGMDAIKVANDV